METREKRLQAKLLHALGNLEETKQVQKQLFADLQER
jgi:hypothetical protein